ncbi:MAG: substrate-binding domain-containing protein [Lentisphaeria bacterium]|nr:substrate-binding domain-containing protein [Lentisphaeria bacterium]
MAQLKYEVVKEFLLEEARRPESVERMPSVRQLMEKFRVSLATVNRALAELENDNIIIRRPGIGISVNRNPVAIGRICDLPREASVVVAYTDFPDEGIWRKIYGIEQYCRQTGIRAVNCKINRETRAAEIVKFVKAQPDCAGLIIKFGADKLSDEELGELSGLGIPVILYECAKLYENAPENIYRLLPDPVDRGTLMAEVLLRNGHRRIGFIRGEPNNDANTISLRSVARRLKLAGIPFGPETTFSTNINPWENSMDAVQELVRRNFDGIRQLGLTALIVTSGSCAMAVLQTLTELGVRVPDEISLIAEGDRTFCRYVLPRLSVVECDYQAMNELAVDIAAGRKQPEKRLFLFPLHLIQRESVRELPPEL